MNELQDAFLGELRDNRIPITLYLVNGFQYRGTVRDFDKFTVSIEADGQSFLIFKKMISTVQASRPLSLEF
ncbi:RNA chaperone Hfq [Staphylospora marina]|uniref:RNA chaperone Hfq n=1 Tax=Staphylospora marina TaxID=2490858 RepID=UPI000F5BFF56|nr:RNA chaperone Hfq [Staphylospora marina]